MSAELKKGDEVWVRHRVDEIAGEEVKLVGDLRGFYTFAYPADIRKAEEVGIEDADWTQGDDGRSNSSEAFERLVKAVENLIREDAHALIRGQADLTAGLIMAQLAHKHGLAPRFRLSPTEVSES